MDGPLYTVNEAAAYLKMAPATVRDWVRSGVLGGRKIGRQYRFSESDLQAAGKRMAPFELPRLAGGSMAERIRAVVLQRSLDSNTRRRRSP